MWPGADSDENLLSPRSAIREEAKNDVAVTVATKSSVQQIADPRTGCEIDEDQLNKVMASYTTEVIPGFLYLGLQSHATDAKQMQMKGYEITHFLNVQQNVARPAYDDIEYENLPIEDLPHEVVTNLFKKANKFIKSAEKRKNGKVLVYCGDKSQSRSATFVLGYLMMANKQTYADAVKELNAKRKAQNQPDVAPNAGFLRQLKGYQRGLKL